MPRSRSKCPATSRWLGAVALAAALLSGPAGIGQSGAGPTGVARPAPAATDPRAQMWVATARFVYQDDPALRPLSQELLGTIRDGNIAAFNRGVDAAVRLENQRQPRQKHVLKFQGLVKIIQEQPISPSDFGGLGQAIVAELGKNADRMNNPERRSGLNALQSQLNQLATGTVTTAAEAASTAPSIADIAPATAPSADAEQFAVPDTAQQPETAYDTPTTPNAMPASATSPLVWAALLLSGLSLLGVLYLLLTRKPAAAPRQRSSAAEDGLNDTQFAQALSLVRRELKAQAARPAPSVTATADAAPRPRPAKNPAPRPAPAAPAPVPQVAPEPLPDAAPEPTDHLFAVEAPAAPVPAEPAAPRVHTLYANQQPINGAFRRDNLADAPASYTIFEIQVDERTPDQGTFVVTRNESGHGGYIGSHMSILEPACTYHYPQGPASRIITETPGTVQRTPAGDWQINQKARIYFA